MGADPASPMQALMQGIMSPQDQQQPSGPANNGSIPPAYPSVPQPPQALTGPPPPMSSPLVTGPHQAVQAGTNAPFWMDAPQAAPQQRTGVAKDKGSSGLQTIGFFAGIIFFVATAGIIGVVVWGPEKHTKSQSHLATDPPPSASLPSLPPDPPPAASAAATDNAPPAESSGGKKSGAKKGGGKWRKH